MTTKALSRSETDERTVYRLPRVNIHETDSAYVIEAEMPGVARDGCDVQVEDRTLTLTGARTTPAGRRLGGRRVDGYQRAFTLGESIDQERVEAAAKDGILTVTLHKVPERVPRTIDVQFN